MIVKTRNLDLIKCVARIDRAHAKILESKILLSRLKETSHEDKTSVRKLKLKIGCNRKYAKGNTKPGCKNILHIYPWYELRRETNTVHPNGPEVST